MKLVSVCPYGLACLVVRDEMPVHQRLLQLVRTRTVLSAPSHWLPLAAAAAAAILQSN